MTTKAQLESVRDKALVAVERQLDGLARHGRDDRFYQEAELDKVVNVYKTFARKARRKGSLPSEQGKNQ